MIVVTNECIICKVCLLFIIYLLKMAIRFRLHGREKIQVFFICCSLAQSH